MKLYKVLDENGSAFHGGRGEWPLPNGQPGDWLEVEGELAPCRHGLHLCRRGDLLTWLGPAIYEAEHEGEKIVNKDKLVVRRARLLRKLDGWNERTARLFAADCAERALKRERKAGREPDPRSWSAVEAARAYANGEISDAERCVERLRNTLRGTLRTLRDAAAAGNAADAAWNAERRWQTKRLLEYAEGVRT